MADNRTIQVLPSSADVAKAAADLFTHSAAQAIATHGRFAVALSGGSTPQTMYRLLATSPYDKQVDWGKVQLFWGDERCVAADHPDSNYGVAYNLLISKVGIPSPNVHRFVTEQGSPTDIAAAYAADLRQHFSLQNGDLPRFDLIFLGMGPDGHTASLFPHTTALHISNQLAAANYVEKLNTTRLTLTAPVLNNAALVAFLVAGPDKATALHEVLEGEPNPEAYPAQLISPPHGKLLWLIDEAAAAQLAVSRAA